MVGKMKSDEVIRFLENRSSPFEFEYIGYEVKTVEEINSIFLMVNPDPRNFELVPPGSLVICHHKISIYSNYVYAKILLTAREKGFNIYNYHLAWDVMEDGIGDSFLTHLGFVKTQFTQIELVYKNHRIPRLGKIIKEKISFDEIISRLNQLNVKPTVLINPQCENQTIGYIPGGGFVDSMIIEMAEAGVGVLISSDPNWVVEIVARELGITLISIDHYKSEKYGLLSMKNILEEQFPGVPITILEEDYQTKCLPSSKNDCSSGIIKEIPLK
jgi:putative NIF3 family GTP cyclohydrolase 1 type 2